MKPFIKWAGGKRTLAPQIVELLPKLFKTYYEPFVGGGAVFWHIDPARYDYAVLNDFNTELINAYKVVRDFPEELLEQVQHLKVTKDVYLRLRKRLPESFSPVRRAARTLFLNKTCFNGLYRVNKKGIFNVMWGDYKNPVIADPEVIRADSEVLAHVKLTALDFEESVKNAKSGDVVYFDPPYIEVSKTSNFTSYTSIGFTMEDQKRLASTFRTLADRGVFLVASNSDTEPVRDLYRGFEMLEVRARRSINSKADRRGPVGELLITSRKTR
jgi:DNA adenine methylase